MPRSLIAGAATVDISPATPQFLFGYPHVDRISTGVHDSLLSSAWYLSDGITPLLMVANDVIFVGSRGQHFQAAPEQRRDVGGCERLQLENLRARNER